MPKGWVTRFGFVWAKIDLSVFKMKTRKLEEMRGHVTRYGILKKTIEDTDRGIACVYDRPLEGRAAYAPDDLSYFFLLAPLRCPVRQSFSPATLDLACVGTFYRSARGTADAKVGVVSRLPGIV